MAEIDNRHDVEPLQFRKCLIGKMPIIMTRTQPCPVNGWAISEISDLHFLNEREVFPPPVIMVAAFHFVDADPSIVDGGHTVFDARRKHEIGDRLSPGSVCLSKRRDRQSFPCPSGNGVVIDLTKPGRTHYRA